MPNDLITLSICIPTFNRSRYLNTLLQDISENFKIFPFQYEIIISSNASTDDTDEVVHNWLNKLPIVYIKQETNIGVAASLNDAYSHARGTFSTYLADDDFLEVEPLIGAIITFIGYPSANILYAPWKLVTLQNKPSGHQFFTIPEDKIFKKGDYLELLELILNHHIFPEIYIFRTSALKLNLPKHNEIAYWAFTGASDYLSFGDIIFLATPFYLSTTLYFDDEVRTQLGHIEVEYAWDRYRGGLEYFSSNICQQLDDKNFDILQKKINAFVIQRMLVGLRIRIQKKRNPVDNYYLARRLCGLGQKSALPVNYDEIRSFAALWDLGNNPDYKNIETIIIVGDELSSIVDHVRSQNTLPVLHLSKHVQGHRNSVFLFKNLDSEFQADMDAELLLGNIFLTERMLMEKFR